MAKKRKYHSKKHIKRYALVPAVVLFIGVLFLLWDLRHDQPYSAGEVEFGMTFSTKYARELGLDWPQVYLAALDEQQIKHFRIPVYWNEIEPVKGQVDLSHVQWMLDEAAARDVEVILAIGQRAPRWPECHPPEWVKNLPREEAHGHEMEMLQYVVEEFRDHPALAMWQVHNEAFFAHFGECPPPDEDFISRSIAHVKQLDPDHLVMTTDSGELSTWARPAGVADVVGISLYRVTWNPVFGYFYYPLTPSFYSSKARLIEPFVDDVFISELQAEPWVSGTILTTPLEDQFRSMNVKRFQNNVDFARRTGFSEVYLWGVEWWYWLKEYHNEPSMWEAGKEVFKQ